MKRWEYKTVTCYGNDDEPLDKAGAEGWEAVGFSQPQEWYDTTTWFVLFKRPLPPPRLSWSDRLKIWRRFKGWFYEDQS